jgi:hypothetical protein
MEYVVSLVTLENSVEEVINVPPRPISDKETVRDLITDIGINYNVSVSKFVLDYDGSNVEGSAKTSPFERSFLDERITDVLGQDFDAAEENTIVLTVTKFDKDTLQKIKGLKDNVKSAKMALKAANDALKAEVAPKTTGGKRKTYRRCRK